MDNRWIPFSERMPLGAPGKMHGMILITNNIQARNAFGNSSHVWLVNMVHTHPDGPVELGGRTLAEKDEITAFAHPGWMSLRNLTHWRPALPEEWE